MFYQDEIKDLPKTYTKTEVNEAEFEMAKTLISSMDRPFDPALYKDEYQERLKEVIGQKNIWKRSCGCIIRTTKKQYNKSYGCAQSKH